MMRINRPLSWRWVFTIVGASALGVLLALIFARLESGADESDAQHAEIVALQAGLEEANSRLEAEGEQPVPVPSVDSEGTVNVVPIPPTPEQTNAAVADWFASHDLSLTSGYSEAMQDAVSRHLTRNPPPAGKDGKDARGPTDQQIADAVAAYLIANPPADGVNGTNGTNGADGRGVVSAVLDGCDVVFTYTNGDTDRVGPLCGKDGKDGSNGSDGRGYVDVECVTADDLPNDGGDWVFTYTDGTTTTVEGPCRVVQPAPSPAATTTKER